MDASLYPALKAGILAEQNATFAALRSARETGQMSDWLNTKTSTDAWRASVSARNFFEAQDTTLFDQLAAGKRDQWRMFLDFAPHDATKAAIRKTVGDSWTISGASGALLTQLTACITGILTACTEKASRGELYFPSTTPITSGVTATKRGYVGTITNDDVIRAIDLP